MKKCEKEKKVRPGRLLIRPLTSKHRIQRAWMLILTVLICSSAIQVMAQSGEEGLLQAYTEVSGYFDTGTDLMYAVGALLGLVGAVKVFQKWNSGDQDTSKVASAWFGSCIFLIVVATVLKAFFLG
ncbi:DUF4134 domain-containing protein [Chitinophaga sp. XS-30]|uniref:DUF4134 domain-containing protein n=1 Tax=Chitinophaga sp. XS-30 TaxID=2604421 RepID=UPI00352B58B0